MWLRLVEYLRCPVCRKSLRVVPFSPVARSTESNSTSEGLAGGWVEAGVLLCQECRVRYPIWHGVPTMLPYRTSVHAAFANEFAQQLALLAPTTYSLPDKSPIAGEEFVLKSFSVEWRDYSYDGVIWEMNYDDHASRFRAEVSSFPHDNRAPLFLEVGCGIGITTSLARENFGGDAVGVDLGGAILSAANHFRNNPHVHFVQASAFYLPFEFRLFDLIYSRGVLHHTYSTEHAFEAVARHCRPGGHLYLWVYGPGSTNSSLLRRMGYTLERAVRPVVARRPESWYSKLFLVTMAVPYISYNFVRRQKDPTIQKYNLSRGVHAARDRFTPLYAHRQSAEEVTRWFRQAGFEQIEVVDWRAMPTADHDDFCRNVGVRGVRVAAGAVSAIGELSHGD